MATLRFSPVAELPHLPQGAGLTGASLLESKPVSGPQTTEQKIRGGDASADWALLVGGYDARAVRGAAHEIRLPNATLGQYRFAYSLSS
jgi:hypothetical protein